MAFPTYTIVALCQKYGPSLKLPPGIDGAKLLYALAGNESSFGANCTPRHEPAYDVGGHYADSSVCRPLLAQFGSAAACSYGPWQLLLANAPQCTPTELMSDADAACAATVAFLNSYVLGLRKAQTVAQIAEIYNSGCLSQHPADGVLRYIRSAVQYYSNAAFAS